MNTERTKELLEIFKKHGISHAPAKKKTTVRTSDLNHVIEYQDCIMQSSPNEIRAFEKDLTPEERKNFFWANANTLSMDSFLDILKSTYIFRQAQQIIDNEIEKEDLRYSEMFSELREKQLRLEKRIETFNECKKPIHKRIEKLRKHLSEKIEGFKYYQTKYHLALETSNDLRNQLNEYREKAQKFDKLRKLLS